MSSRLDVPLWMALLGLTLSSLWLLQHFLLPCARWMLRRRANRLIDDVNTRLALRIPSFKLTRRSVLVDRLTFHPRVVALVDDMADTEEVPREVLMQKVGLYAREIVPAFNALLYFKAAYWAARALVHALYRVRLGYADDEALKKIGARSSVVFLMNHRSNMDYILATYLAAERTALSYAVGEWARIWPLQQLIRAMGGFFVRRDSGNLLYRRVLECYVQMAAEGGVPQAVFPEGRLSRDGRLANARLGLLGYMTRGFDPEGVRDIVFIPVGINYDRVIEDRSLLRSADKLPPRSVGKSCRIFLAYGAKTLWQALWGRRYRNGYACVNFGEPVSLREWMRTRGLRAGELIDVTPLATELMQRIGRITPILPVALVTTLYVRAPARSSSAIELKAEVLALLDQLEAGGHRAYIPRGDYNYAVDVGLRMLTLRRILVEENGVYSANPAERGIIAYYANSIAHLFSEQRAMAEPPGSPAPPPRRTPGVADGNLPPRREPAR
ncbi:MAG: glycerol-3-phosphate acyltransferase [Granulosicoccus sp.]|nr:glycerol-3-phosphate acyltransferase [Granulosicoccus sp.]